MHLQLTNFRKDAECTFVCVESLQQRCMASLSYHQPISTTMTTGQKAPTHPSFPLDLPRDNYPYPPPFLLNGCGWDGVKVITGPWIFVPTHFISVRLPTGKSMSSALMKDPHLYPMDLLVFIFSPNMVSMRSLDTMAHISYSMWHWRTSAHSHFLIVEGRLFTNHAECANFHHIQIGSLDRTSSSGDIFIGNQAEQVSTSQLHYTHAITVLNVLCQ